MDLLREEILKAEEQRNDLQKWKLGLVGTLGAAGLGIVGATELDGAELVLCAIPPAAIYVDLLCRHLTLRILVIGTFLREQRRSEDAALRTAGEYESFVDGLRDLPESSLPFRLRWLGARLRRILTSRPSTVFDLEDWALDYSTYAFCGALAAYGGYGASGGLSIAFLIAGLSGLAAGRLSSLLFERRFERIRGGATAGEAERPSRVRSRGRETSSAHPVAQAAAAVPGPAL